MKKIYTLLAVLLTAVFSIPATAQVFKVTNNGEDVKDGDVITIKAEEEVLDYGDFVLELVEAKSNPTVVTGLLIENVAGTSQDVRVTARVDNSTAAGGYAMQMCCGGLCQRAVDGMVTKEFSLKSDPLPTPFQYDVDFLAVGNYGTVKTSVTVISGSQTLNFSVEFVYEQEEGNKFDLNGDGNVDVSDVTLLVGYVLESDGTHDADYDLTGDGAVDIGDVTELVAAVLGQ
ncbi:MAG: dockerin type I repeat-containing protein [Alloprevotella sp.]|nr:dockerin type I repeat-containing protein [Alloprevotella sp.]